MEWLFWHGLHAVFWLFGRRTYAEPSLAEGCGAWQRELCGYTLQIEVTLYQRGYGLFRGEQPIARVVF